jgi:uncharacterized protein
MLQLRPSCEHCARPLPPEATEARICSYECTFCRACVEGVLHNVCPNCGGGFVPRPVRPAREWQPGVSSIHQPPSEQVVHKPVDPEAHRKYAAAIMDIPSEAR